MATKGKQGTKGQKQINQENKTTLSFYSYLIFASYVPSLLYRFIWNYELISYTDVGFLVFSSLVFGLCMKAMSSMATSSLDLNMHQGMGEHLKDVILVTVACQLLSMYSLYFWGLWGLIPLTAMYKLWVGIISPWVFQEAVEPTEKQKRKMERKAIRRQ